MYKHLFKTVLGVVGIFGIVGFLNVGAEYSQVINITGFNESGTSRESGQLIQSFTQKWDDLDIYFVNDVGSINHYTMMDRNMGATEVYNLEPYNEANDASFGWFYQFGNNYGFPSTGTMEGIGIQQAAHANGSIWSQYIPSKYARNTRSTYSTRMDGTSNSNNGGGIWGGTGDKANSYEGGTTTKIGRKGPCSSGYYIPSQLDWYNLSNLRIKSNNESRSNRLGFSQDFLLPLAGYRKENKTISNTGWGYYHSSSPSSSHFDSQKLALIYQIYYSHNDARSNGVPIRCFKILPNSDILNIYANSGKNAMITVHSGKFIKLGSPSKQGFRFGGWYSTPKFQEGSEVITGNSIPDNASIYARWLCPEGYIDNEGKCIKLHNIIYNLNNGIIPGESKNPTGYTTISEDITLINPIRTGYTFTGRSGTELDSPTMSVTIPSGSTGDRSYEANRKINQYTIMFDTDGGTNIPSITADYGTGITAPANPTKNAYTFKGRDREIPSTMPAGNITIKAIWEKNGSSGGGGGGGGGGASSSSCKNLPTNAVANNNSKPSSNTNYYYSTNTSKVCTFQCKSGYTRNEQKETCDKVSDTQTTSGTNVKEPEANTGNNTKVETGNNTEIQTGSKIDTPEQASQDNKQDTQDFTTKTPEGKTNSTTSSTYSPEFQEAYEFAKGNGITTMPTIQKANMEGKLTRIAMAKMLSQYAMNVLGQKPANIITPKFNDVTDKQNSDYDDGVTLAYQLGIMGQNMPNNKFRPDDEVTRAEFATALSRMAYGTSDGEYKGTAKYYIHHMEKLVREGIITNDDPNMKELRGYVMIMLMRSSK